MIKKPPSKLRTDFPRCNHSAKKYSSKYSDDIVDDIDEFRIATGDIKLKHFITNGNDEADDSRESVWVIVTIISRKIHQDSKDEMDADVCE